MGLLDFFIPKETKFFDMLESQADNFVEGARELKSFVDGYDKLSVAKRKGIAQKIKRIEDKGDVITHEILANLDTAFVTPIDKEDLHNITILMDDVVDLIDSASRRFIIFNINKTDRYIKDLTANVLDAVLQVHKGISELRKLKNMKNFYIKMHSIENASDDLYHSALEDLFSDGKNAVVIIKYKEIYELLEQITDTCENIANHIESVVVKHA